jgi:PAS domain S-box-containing protein
MKTKSLLNRRVRLALGVAILASLVVAAISYRSTVASTESGRWVRHTHEVLENLQNLLAEVQSTESSYRGFALTGKESYLDSYRASILSAEQGETTVRNLTVDNPKQQILIATLERLAAQKIQFGETVINLRRTRGMEAAADPVQSGTDERIMDEFQGVVRQMREEELRLLVLRDADAKRRLGQTKTVLILGTVLSLLIAAAAGWSVQRDSIKRGLAEEALRDQEEKYRLLIDGVQDYAIFTLDSHGMVASWNAGAERIKGYKADEIIGQNFSRFYLQNDIDQGKPEAELLIAAASGRSEIEHWRVRKDGSQFWASVVITAAHDSSGRLLGFSEISQDISLRKKSEQHLMKTVGELKRSNDELQQFAYVASHDLQEPLRMVASYTQLLAKRYKGRLDPEADEFIAYAVDGSNRMQGLIQDLLAYSRAGTNGRALREVSSEKALKDALLNLRVTIQESGALVTHDWLPAITSDDTQLVQVFQNLVGNAIKYRSVEVPQVHVSATKNGGKEWIFSVRDNGLGIDPQYFERIFVLFQRLHGREEFKGTGIGLTICKKIVERLGGKIWVESPPEEGSIFYFSLPERDGNDGVDWNRRGPYRSSVG